MDEIKKIPETIEEMEKSLGIPINLPPVDPKEPGITLDMARDISNSLMPLQTELTHISLSPGEVLSVKITSGDMGPDELNHFRDKFKEAFPNNKVMLFCVPPGDNIEFTAIKDSTLDCSVKVCEDCTCGKGNSNESQ